MPEAQIEQVGEDLKVTMADGRKFRVRGATVDQARTWLESKGSKVTSPGAVAKQPLPPGVLSDQIGPGGTFLKGMEDPYIGLHQRYIEATGSPEDIAREKGSVEARESDIRRRSEVDPNDWRSRVIRGAGSMANPINAATAIAAPEAASVLGLGRVGSGIAAGAAGGAIGAGAEPKTNVLPGEEGSELARSMLIGGGAGGVLGGVGGQVGRVTSRTATAGPLREAATKAYDDLKSSNFTIDGNRFRANVSTIIGQLRANTFRDYRQPQTFRALDELLNHPGDVNMGDIQNFDSLLGSISGEATDASERRAAHTARDMLNGYLDRMPQSHVKGGSAGDVQKLREAASNWRSLRRSEAVDNAQDRAALRAATTGTGANIENTIRQEIRKLINQPSQASKFTAEELQEMRRVAEGAPLTNLLRRFGKFAPSGPVSSIPALLSGLGGEMAGGHKGAAVAAGLVGGGAYAAKKGGEFATNQAASDIANKIRATSPHYRANPPPRPAWWWRGMTRAPSALAPGMGGALEQPDEPLAQGP